ncbi:MAG: asparaginase [Candidatus Magasanikbacteria bacterium CG_4_9_14_0_2_um_filter_41_10]|uniref:Asparaginase n=1 Tax=Candidatus Magasanikbacteria bacterium CG_4_10_14_0_2_um_filter_41_31 TaxID=1974639 RepID=A0A2M7V339_9BACT|nr:MAG: asparaginase [Candidatus Magasanikbacteria bacterium CG1_02_41_34]PIZ92873.1 MAG: asparaginase [Candidatus Magasanikbacteria bacterium CG_4_10_14_0_2_um_filter_41_31]PJC53187.1 MAG: asparaginase [Candidatus Magasanikbacteria bacterium CG_4_9_14_0_2_um_filter_41_10]
MDIKLFVTGGTFDKEYNELTGELVFNNTHILEMLKRGRSNVNIEVRTLMMIDSLFMTREDRLIILDHCQKTEEDKIVITHGTDTMVETAQLLASDIQDKTIVLTGAMIPYTFGSSDGQFNLGSAIAFVQTLEHGVYIAMNGKYFQWSNVKKNKQTGVFEELSSN